MNVKQILKQIEKFTIDNSPSILTAFGVVGTVTTAYLTSEASVKAYRIIVEECGLDPDALTLRKKLDLVWKEYIPPVVTGTLTISAIIGASHIQERRASAIAAAYTISERAFFEYKEKVVERVGKAEEEKYRAEIAEERVRKDPPEESKVIVTGNGEVMCLDMFSGRYFMSDMETIRRAENTINFQIIHDGYASVSDLYMELDLPATDSSGEFGWNTDYPLSIVYDTVLSDNGVPCIAISYQKTPRAKYDRFNS